MWGLQNDFLNAIKGVDLKYHGTTFTIGVHYCAIESISSPPNVDAGNATTTISANETTTTISQNETTTISPNETTTVAANEMTTTKLTTAGNVT